MVEDDVTVAKLLKVALTRAGYEVFIAGDYASAREALGKDWACLLYTSDAADE